MNGRDALRRDSFFDRLHWSGSARHLAVIRIVVGLHLLQWVFRSDYLAYVDEMSAGSAARYWSVIPAYGMTASVAHSLQWIGFVACSMMIVGLCTRVATVLTTASFLLTNHFYYIYTGNHDDWLYFNFILLTLCCARCADAWSLDAWWRSPRGSRPNSQVYRWPVEVMLAWFCLLYVEAGIAKLFPLEHGMAWFTGGTIQSVAIARLLDSPVYWWFGQALFDYRLQWPFVLMASVSVLIELSAVIPLITGRWNGLIFAAVMALHIGIYSVGVPGFPQLALACGCLFLRPEWFGDCSPHPGTVVRDRSESDGVLRLAA